jgi:hypothetical protein
MGRTKNVDNGGNRREIKRKKKREGAGRSWCGWGGA